MSLIRPLFAASNGLAHPKLRLPFNLSLYLVANQPSYPDEQLFLLKIKESVKGGVSCVQFRNHKSDFSTVVTTAARLKQLLKGVPLFINTLDSIKVAQSVGAEGVYLEDNSAYSEARLLLGEEAIIGISVKTREDVQALEQTDAVDYLSVKVSASKRTCPRNDALWGLEGLREVRSLSSHRIVAIGGINGESAKSVYKELHSTDGIAMAGGLMEENDPSLTAERIRAILQEVREGK